MAKCSKCSKSQSRLNNGGLCRSCFQKKPNNDNANGNNELNSSNTIIETNKILGAEQANDRTMIDLIKDNMLNERKWNDDMQSILKNKLDFFGKKLL